MQVREKLSRERVIEAALHVLDEEGVDAVTMRRIGRELGVEAMSLYNHVRDKEDLMDGICTAIMAGFDYPEIDEQDLLGTGRRAALAWRQVLKAHPNVTQIFAERTKPMTAPEAMRPMEFALDLLRRAGLSDRDAVRTFNAFGGYIQGFVLMETGQMWDRHGAMGSEVPIDAFPAIAACMPHLVGADADEEFEYGLDLMFEGLRAKLDSAQV
jgi:AcrR family transcriptional regulator